MSASHAFAAAFSLGVLSLAAAACTPASSSAAAPALAGGARATGSVFTIDVDLTRDPGGYAPAVTMLAVGDGVRFTNSDGFAHTATSITGSAFPVAYPFDAGALVERGATLSGGFSTGSLEAGRTSQILVADARGTYLFGCYYHYGAPMRAQIVVR